MNRRATTLLILGAVATLVAIVRYFMEGWVEPLGLPPAAGSLFASVTIVLAAGLVIIFVREGRMGGAYVRAAAWFAALAVWCEMLV